jgi:hypothetical protein
MIISGENINKTTIKGVKAIMAMGGACIVSDWTNGSGRHTTRRPTPAFCEELTLWSDERGADFTIEYYELKGSAAKAIRKIMKNHPRAHSAIVCTNIRGARKALKVMESA